MERLLFLIGFLYLVLFSDSLFSKEVSKNSSMENIIHLEYTDSSIYWKLAIESSVSRK